MANKKNPDRINKDCVVRVRVTKEEHIRFMEKAAENGFKSVSDYIRTLIVDEDDANVESKLKKRIIM